MRALYLVRASRSGRPMIIRCIRWIAGGPHAEHRAHMARHHVGAHRFLAWHHSGVRRVVRITCFVIGGGLGAAAIGAAGGWAIGGGPSELQFTGPGFVPPGVGYPTPQAAQTVQAPPVSTSENVTAVPEPSSLALFVLPAIAAIAVARRRG